MTTTTIEIDYGSAMSMLESAIDEITDQHTSLLCAAIALATPSEARWVEVYLYDVEPSIVAVYDAAGGEIAGGDHAWWIEICKIMGRIYHQHAALPTTDGPSDDSFRMHANGDSEVYDLLQWREGAALRSVELVATRKGKT